MTVYTGRMTVSGDVEVLPQPAAGAVSVASVVNKTPAAGKPAAEVPRVTAAGMNTVTAQPATEPVETVRRPAAALETMMPGRARERDAQVAAVVLTKQKPRVSLSICVSVRR